MTSIQSLTFMSSDISNNLNYLFANNQIQDIIDIFQEHVEFNPKTESKVQLQADMRTLSTYLRNIVSQNINSVAQVEYNKIDEGDHVTRSAQSSAMKNNFLSEYFFIAFKVVSYLLFLLFLFFFLINRQSE